MIGSRSEYTCGHDFGTIFFPRGLCRGSLLQIALKLYSVGPSRDKSRLHATLLIHLSEVLTTSESIQALMQDSTSLQYSVLANAASHVHWIDGKPQMQELALSYYSRSIRGLSDTLAGKGPQDENATLMSVMLLYLHGVGLASQARDE
jgi:hypothetical protein